jgi:RNA polymerase sigma factor (sigma-70 family)
VTLSEIFARAQEVPNQTNLTTAIERAKGIVVPICGKNLSGAPVNDRRGVAEAAIARALADIAMALVRKKYDPHRPAVPWVVKIATNAARREIKASRRSVVPQAAAHVYATRHRERHSYWPPDEVCSGREARERVRELLDQLPSLWRDIIYLRLWCNWSFARIAEELELPRATVYDTYCDALEQLQAMLKR